MKHVCETIEMIVQEIMVMKAVTETVRNGHTLATALFPGQVLMLPGIAGMTMRANTTETGIETKWATGILAILTKAIATTIEPREAGMIPIILLETIVAIAMNVALVKTGLRAGKGTAARAWAAQDFIAIPTVRVAAAIAEANRQRLCPYGMLMNATTGMANETEAATGCGI